MIPENFYKYKQMPLWDETTLPKAFLEKHNTKLWVYARICIVEWSIQYQSYNWDWEIDAQEILTPSNFGISHPQQWHSLTILWSVKFFVEFYKQKDEKALKLEEKLKEKYESKTPHYEITSLLAQEKLQIWSSVLDVGCGGWRNSFMLADNGMYVDALDINQNSLANIQVMARENNWPISPKQVDLENYTLQGEYDLVFSTVVLQFLQKNTALRIVKEMQESTKERGYNIIIVPIDSDDYSCPLRFPWLFKKWELKNMYSDWDIQEYNEMFGFFHKKDEVGNCYGSRFATIVAQKK